jgi:hypothetical protein
MMTPRAQRDEPGVGRKRFEYPHGALPTEDAHLRGGEAGVSLLAETPLVPTPYSGETGGGPNATASQREGAGNLTTRSKYATTPPMRTTDQTSSSSSV